MSRKDNESLLRATENKNDEFFTRYEDIERELQYYDLTGKSIYCNCDNPYESNFVHYFVDNFERLGIKYLVATHISKDESSPVKMTYDGNRPEYSTLNGDGDFRSEECIGILKECDVVITNPPFSLFRVFISTIINNKKDFLVIGSQNAISYVNFFSLIKNEKVRVGVNYVKEFGISDVGLHKYTKNVRWCDKSEKYIAKFGNVIWFTTLQHNVHKPLTLTETYSADKYQKYDNFNAINVDRVSQIPKNYSGAMGVPITYINKHDSDMFRILGKSGDFAEDIIVNGQRKNSAGRFYINGKRKYDRVVIKRLNKI